jgi:hypothetical protein
MTATEMNSVIGKIGMLRTEDFRIEVEIVDVRQVWNRTDYRVTPTHGIGNKWVSAERVSM